MALFVNSFTFSGFVGQDAEVRRLPSGHDVCNFSVALCKRKKEDPTLWLTIAAYGKTGEFASKLRKSDHWTAIWPHSSERLSMRTSNPGAWASIHS